MWCVLTTASDRAFWKLRERGIALVDVELLATCFSTLVDAARSNNAAAARFGRDRMPHADCLAPETIGRSITRVRAVRPALCLRAAGAIPCYRPGAIGEVRTAFEAADVSQSVSGYCRNAAAQVLFTADEHVVEELAICFFAHVAEHVGSRDPVMNIGQVFKKSKVAPE